MVALGALISATRASAFGPENFSIPSSARQLIVVSSATYHPPGYLATFRTFQRANPSSPWKPVFADWRAEIGSGDLVNVRHFGDHATPTGVFTIGARMYGNEPRPRGLDYPYHRLVCGDWWDEDPASARYNRFVVVPCGVTPGFAAGSEALWTETVAYPYFAVIEFNTHPIRRGRGAPGSGIFLHSWVDAPTDGCVAIDRSRLLSLLRWLAPSRRPVIAISVIGAGSRTSSGAASEGH